MRVAYTPRLDSSFRRLRLIVFGFVADALRPALANMNEVFIGTGRAHRLHAPEGCCGRYSGDPVVHIAHERAINRFRTNAPAGSGRVCSFLSHARPPTALGSGPILPAASMMVR